MIIAALSVQRWRGGTCRRRPCSIAAASSPARSGPLAATPPVSTMRLIPWCSAAFTVLRTSILTTVAWNEAAMSAISARPSGPRRLTWNDTDVLTPLKEKSAPPSLICASGNVIAFGSPSTAVRSMTGPPGNPRPRSFATLSNASPAASSRV